jgi:uncharacterized protein (DUF362 family)
MKSKSQLTRRQFIISASAALGSLGLIGVRRMLARAGNNDIKDIFLPMIVRNNDPTFPGKVVHIHNPNATNWQPGVTDYWTHVDQVAVNDMVNQGLMTLTETSTVAGAWSVILPSYQPGQKIAIKVNFNNSQACNNTDAMIDALIQPVNGVVSGLEQIGVSRSDICVYDAIRSLPKYFVDGGLPGISFYDRNCRNLASFTKTSETQVVYNPPPDIDKPISYVNNVLMNATYLINMPIMKGSHPVAGVTLGAKNHFGTIHQPSDLHNLVSASRNAYYGVYNPLVDFFRSPLIGGKTVLTIGDGLFAARHFNLAPELWATFSNHVPNSLFFSRDMVAIDCVMYDLLVAELQAGVPTGADNYLRMAGQAGLGVYEKGNPWQTPYGSGYQNIQYLRVEV